MNNTQQKGFTLIELVIVIVILGILAVTAAPKFLDMSGDATRATVEAVEASVKSSSDMIHAKLIIAGTHKEATASVTADGETYNAVYGYPAATTAEWLKLLDGNVTAGTTTTACASDFCVIVGGVTSAGVYTAGGTTGVIIYPKGKKDVDATPTASTCHAYFVAATGSTAATASVSGAVTTGC
ncbi:type II secretion system protein [Algibacillus agarilyticus]|uniref:type II secretion system protein n=1 Tax=Algibacillus agarilyticus TaxID=2234133 RepID=UPI000DCF9BE0|nr:type II secretion system protein [Algibacillus agarilyticus]